MSATTKQRRTLSLRSSALLMLGLGTAALIGLPAMTGARAPEGLLQGVLSDPEGDKVEGAPVALFDGQTNAILEITHTDSDGRFGFQQDPGSHHVHAMAPAGSKWTGAWSLDREAGQRQIDLQLANATLFEAKVHDEAGQPITGAEVRVYAPSAGSKGLGVLVQARTDSNGSAHLMAPEGSHIAAFSSDLRHRAHWYFNQSPEGRNPSFDFTLKVGRPVRGTVVDEDGRPLSGVVISSWEAGADTPQWNGYQVTGKGGTFLFYGGGKGTLLRATDRKQQHLPAERTLEGAGDAVLVLTSGQSQTIRCRTRSGLPQESILWAWSDQAAAWSWGTTTDSTGLLEASLDDSHGLVIETLGSGIQSRIQTFGRSFTPGLLQIEFDGANAEE
ncbi:MAG: hypothetical protein ACI82F_002493 [Planctomycetota bacterium]|jgi:hypothetical protein